MSKEVAITDIISYRKIITTLTDLTLPRRSNRIARRADQGARCWHASQTKSTLKSVNNIEKSVPE